MRRVKQRLGKIHEDLAHPMAAVFKTQIDQQKKKNYELGAVVMEFIANG